MNLEVETLTGVVAAMRLRGGARTWEDRRAMGRIPMQKVVAIIPYRAGIAGEAVNVWIRDISAGGIGLIHSHRMEPNEEFVIRLPRVDGSELPVVCAVAHCAALGPELFTIGARFVRTLSEEASPPHSQGAAK
jgi:hypothetical protein